MSRLEQWFRGQPWPDWAVLRKRRLETERERLDEQLRELGKRPGG